MKAPLRLKDATLELPHVRYFYSALLSTRAQLARLSGNRLLELHCLLRAWRALAPTPPHSLSHRVHHLIREACYDGATLLPISHNKIWTAFARTREASAIRAEFARFPLADRIRLRYPRPDDNPERQGDLIILKRWNPATGEKGVLLLAYTEAARRFAAMYDLGRVAPRYMIVLEPSWWGYQDETFLCFVGRDAHVIVQAPWRPDYEFILDLSCNLTPTRLGAGDWVDPAAFTPRHGTPKKFDLAVVSSWSPVKRHSDLFRALAVLKHMGHRSIRVVLVGYPVEWTLADVMRLARRYGVADLCTFYEGISHAEVADVLARSRAYILLSRREGANRAWYEALFCDLPVAIYRHHRGVNIDAITPEVGVLFDEHDLPHAIMRLLDPEVAYQPRQWAMRNTGAYVATEHLNRLLRELAVADGLPWTEDIVAKKNAPNLMYAKAGVYRSFESEYCALGELLLPP
ncbi:MAG TPA: glycosyltransferase [Dehalococcoidia bacterium]|nr:glycosyltransferase [Dehalococcoidia bacterium]